MKSAGVVSPPCLSITGLQLVRAVAGAFQRMIELGVAGRNRPRVDANLFGHPLAEHRQTEAKGFPFRAAAHAAKLTHPATFPLQGADRGPGVDRRSIWSI